jgi:L,D-peptidoglycan transpeptidase YkuD (ErfK/YbiS/YcfS/YnhG family)
MLALALGTLTAACAPPPAVVPAATRQVIAVTAETRGTTYASARLWTRSGRCWHLVAGPWTARVGRSGLSPHHVEGDGTTPTGVFALDDTVLGTRPDPGVRYPYHRIVCGDWWDEDASSPTYNTFQHLPCGRRPPFRAESEGLWKPTTAYRYLLPIRYNADPIVPGRGSAIFLHVQRPNPTNGCVSLPEAQLVQTLRWLRPDAEPRIAIRVGH